MVLYHEIISCFRFFPFFWGLVMGCGGFIAGRAHHHDYQGGMRSGGRFGTHRRTARRLAQVCIDMEKETTAKIFEPFFYQCAITKDSACVQPCSIFSCLSGTCGPHAECYQKYEQTARANVATVTSSRQQKDFKATINYSQNSSSVVPFHN